MAYPGPWAPVHSCKGRDAANLAASGATLLQHAVSYTRMFAVDVL